MDGGDGESVVEDEDDVLMGNVHMIYSNLMDGEFRWRTAGRWRGGGYGRVVGTTTSRCV